MTIGLSTGGGTAGKLQITDTGKENAQGQPLVTEYYRQGGQVYTNSYYAKPDGTVASVVSSPAQYSGPNAGARSASYQPAAARFVWEDGQDLSVTVWNGYASTSWIGIVHLGTSNLVRHESTAGTPAPAASPANGSRFDDRPELQEPHSGHRHRRRRLQLQFPAGRPIRDLRRHLEPPGEWLPAQPAREHLPERPDGDFPSPGRVRGRPDRYEHLLLDRGQHQPEPHQPGGKRGGCDDASSRHRIRQHQRHEQPHHGSDPAGHSSSQHSTWYGTTT